MYRLHITNLCFAMLLSSLTYAQLQPNGTAFSIQDSCYVLTPNIASTIGTIWDQTPLDLSESKQWNMDINLGCSNTGADGMVFILHNQKNVNTIAGGSIGYAGLSPSLVIEMDTYTNGSLGDPNYDHLGLMLNGNHNHSQDLINNIPIDPGFANVEDCIYHQAQINWLADVQILEFYWDCELRFSTSIDIKEDVFPNSNDIYWGFIATTGGAVNTHAICFTTPPENVEEIELEDITICEGESIQLNAALGYDNYFWSPDTGLSDPNSPSPVLQAISSTTYTLQAFNNCGQISEDTFSLEVIDNVTPNQDLYSLDICPNTELLITGPANFESYDWAPASLFDINNEQEESP